MKLPIHKSDPAHRDFQYLEDLSTAYWYSELLFAALDLNLFEYIERGSCTLDALADASCCNAYELNRLLRALKRLDLVQDYEGRLSNSQVVRLYLLPDSRYNLKHFLLYRRYMQAGWKNLVGKLCPSRESKKSPVNDDYDERTYSYVLAMDQLAKVKAREIMDVLALESWNPPILDVGGGAGSLTRALLGTKSDGTATLFELPEVIAAAKKLYPEERYWDGFSILEGDFRTADLPKNSNFGLIILSNFLHAYGNREAGDLLNKAAGLLDPEGFILVHDYFPDRLGRSPHKGSLYDLNMMLNTYDGECHDMSTVTDGLKILGMKYIRVKDLNTDSSVIIASRKQSNRPKCSEMDEWIYIARDMGFQSSVILSTDQVMTASWVREKCRCGCARFAGNLQCPPHGLKSRETREFLDSYKICLLLEGSPPGKDFHNRLLEMERKAFLAGFHKAFVFGAGPCSVCPTCSTDEMCRFPEKARPSMEGSGIDVYGTAHAAGIIVQPVTSPNDYVKYFGLLLLE